MRRQLIWGLLALLCGCVSVPASAGSVVLSWTAPTQNVDGSTLTDLEGYNVYEKCGTIDTPFTMIQYVPKTEQSYQHYIPNDGKMCWWSVSAVATSGESVKSNTVSRLSVPETITASFAWAQRAEVPPSMTTAFVQAAHALTSATAGPSSITANFAANITAGNSIAIFVFDYTIGNAPGLTVTSTGETVIAVDGTDLNDGGSSTWKTFYIKNATGGHTDVTLSFTYTGGNYPRLAIVEVSGVDTTAPLDAHMLSPGDSTHFNNTGTADANTAAITPVTNGCILVAAMFQGSEATIPTVGTGWTNADGFSDAAGDGTRVEYKVQTTAAAINATWTYTGGATTADFAVLAFKPASGAAAASLPPVPQQRQQYMMALLAQ